ncbi:hypothetical protein HETIRDRAFT_442634 [Heterobasidion irregulare TC 32-1]|uniref:Uncharacterized protein n=1 Tax=Heterobasidion irregulare (strain TC 32-1) TaxID=747525 RepID=W4JM32_HETIT|nr:uncharacterized protein HETIRDRAFT_442634 [Heterobasidion irregulare TC 32-1]ETW74588.1 hypothetical protein HETIRDRAFT_442634 [Heterobasidion irregulare TC 32-1]
MRTRPLAYLPARSALMLRPRFVVPAGSPLAPQINSHAHAKGIAISAGKRAHSSPCAPRRTLPQAEAAKTRCASRSRRYARAPPSPPHPPCTSSCGPASSAVQRHIDSSSSPSISPHASTPPTALACTRR